MADEGLVWGLQNGDLEAVKNALDKGKINDTISGGRSAIHVAADYGQTEVIKYLVENGADVNKEDEHGITPLLAAIWENHTETVKYLLEKGASMNKKDPSGRKYIDCADTDEMKLILS